MHEAIATIGLVFWTLNGIIIFSALVLIAMNIGRQY